MIDSFLQYAVFYTDGPNRIVVPFLVLYKYSKLQTLRKSYFSSY